jgi:penicillin G amidase
MSDVVDQLRARAAAALAPTDGELVLPGLGAPVDVRFDQWGIPSVRAGSLEDLWLAQGFLSAAERLFQIELALRAANGRLSEVFSDATLQDDRFARTVGFHRAGATYAASWTPEARAMIERFVEGARAWVDRLEVPPVEYALLDRSPELPHDVAAWASCWAFFAWGLSSNWDAELLRVRLREAVGEELAGVLLPPTPALEPALVPGGLDGHLLHDAPLAPRGQGSNAWVVAGSRTAGGGPLLANDPHLVVSQPPAWLEFHLRAPGYEARGVAFPMFPAIALGATRHHAWGATNVTGDVQDLFVERLSEDGTTAMFGEGWEPLEVHWEEIRVRGRAEPDVLEVRESRHGPILETAPVGVAHVEHRSLSTTYALRWTGHDEGVDPLTFVRAAQAESFEEFRRAVRGLSCAGQNFVYADVDGHIGYQLTGRYPIRASGDGTAPVPGWTGEHEWVGVVPFEELPWAKDPERGYLVTANNRPHDADYPHVIGHDFHAPYRARRIAELIQDAPPGGHTVDSMRRIQTDTVGLHVREVLDRLPAGIREAFRGWNGDLASSSSEAALFARFVRHTAALLLADPLLLDDYLLWRESFVCDALPALLDTGRLPADQLARALAAARSESADETWGELHRVRFAHPLARIPGLEELFVAAEHELGGDEQTVAQAGFDGRGGGFEAAVVPSWRAVYDLADLDRSAGVLTTGQSGNPASPHWSDQAPAWTGGELRLMPIGPAALEAAAVSALRLTPG